MSLAHLASGILAQRLGFCWCTVVFNSDHRPLSWLEVGDLTGSSQRTCFPVEYSFSQTKRDSPSETDHSFNSRSVVLGESSMCLLANFRHSLLFFSFSKVLLLAIRSPSQTQWNVLLKVVLWTDISVFADFDVLQVFWVILESVPSCLVFVAAPRGKFPVLPNSFHFALTVFGASCDVHCFQFFRTQPWFIPFQNVISDLLFGLHYAAGLMLLFAQCHCRLCRLFWAGIGVCWDDGTLSTQMDFIQLILLEFIGITRSF